MSNLFYQNNRNRISELLPNDSILILFAGKEICKSADEAYPFTINRNFYYLTGINEENDIFVMKKNNNITTSLLFINEYDEVKAKWVGKKLFKDEAFEISGIEEIKYITEFDLWLNQNLTKEENIYLDLEAPLFDEPYGEAKRLQKKLENAGHQILSAFEILAYTRMKKSIYEVEMIKKAIDITKFGIEAIMQNIQPGMYEYQIESYFDQQIKYHGASGFAFNTIAASGKNACVLHYVTNNSIIGENELVLFDLGAEYNLYKADITRTIPANGKFTSRQKEIYNIVLAGQKLIFDSVKPGLTPRDLNNILIKFYMTELKKIGLIENDNDVYKYYFHGVSHHLGLDTHDIAGRDKVLEPGCIITVEPGLYISEEAIGIRIEDDVLVTETGCEVLSQDIIRTVEEIENYMQKRKKANHLNKNKNNI